PDPKRIVASLPLAMFLLAPDLTVASVNPAAEQLVGRGARRLQGQPVRDLFEFDEPLILERLADRESHLFARDARVHMPNLTTRELDVIT
ncbi:PAS domain-containing protein, partial [Salmonella enterica]|uniref:PAS domain-containing protein n=1 Tax=Salmonella enterica TaxID=28901 RepID=UPI003D296279